MIDSKKYSFIIHMEVWQNLPETIDFFIKSRSILHPLKSLRLVRGINTAIILNSTCIIEGFLNDVIDDIIGNEFFRKKVDDLYGRLLNDCDEKRSRANKTDFFDLFELLYGAKISSLIDNELNKTINLLFIFRNSLIHGKGIEKKVMLESTEYDLNNEYKRVFDYLLEKKLIQNPGVYSSDLLTNEIVEHFYIATKQFVIFLYDKLKNKMLYVLMDETIEKIRSSS
jgi:hypothetical protein